MRTGFSGGRSGDLVFPSLEEFSRVYCDPHKGFGIDNKAEVYVFLEFPRQEYWSGLPFPTSGDLPDPGFEPMSPASAGRFFTTSAIWEASDLSIQ